MAPMLMENGIQNGMPLTEYSATPDSHTEKRTRASSLLPESFLYPDGHPDVHYLPLDR